MKAKLLTTALLVVLIARAARSQSPTTSGISLASISGVVRDSIAAGPLGGALVQLVAADTGATFSRTVVSDSVGRFAFTNVPDGRYAVGFFHPMLDSLGVSAPLRELRIVGGASQTIDLAIPGPARIRSAICRSLSRSDSGAVVMGIVRDWRSRAPIGGAHVAADWMEIAFTSTGIVRSQPRVTTSTTESGWFALCNVPAAGNVSIIADRGRDSTDRVEMIVPKNGFLRRDLYIGSSVASIVTDSSRGDSIVRQRTVHTGEGQLTGKVIAVASRRPVAGAQVDVAGGPRTRTNDSGEWTLTNVPTGTRLLEVRAVAFYPERTPVDVVAAPRAIHTELFTLKAMLDTVKTQADRLRGDATGFEFRRRSSGVGRFLSAADIARGAAFYPSDILRRVPGVSVDLDTIKIRGAFGECTPALYINGTPLPSIPTPAKQGAGGIIQVDDIDAVISNPKDIIGIEIYYDHAPPQFQRGFSGCGAIVIWTK